LGRKYTNPPVLEAICEFRFNRDTPWDTAIPGLLYEKLREEFPLREDRLVHEWDSEWYPTRTLGPIVKVPKVIFLSETKNFLVEVGRRQLAVHAIRPYPSWSAWKAQIMKAWENLCKVVEVKGFRRIGLRYVNKIEMPNFEGDLKRYFHFYPCFGECLPQNILDFLLVVQYVYEEGRDRCVVSLGRPLKPNTFFLDIDYFVSQPDKVPVSDVPSWVEKAHCRVEEIFEGCITDRLRQLFGPEDD